MKDLLLEYIPFQASQNEIKESITTNNGKLIVSGVLQRAGAKNQNGRVYPKEILQREAEKYNNEFVKQNRALGETDHPSCHSASAEVMTTNGWKFLKDLDGNETVFTLNRFTNQIEAQKINKVIKEPYKGKMITLKGMNINTMVTPNHKFLVTNRKGENLFMTAQEILDLSKKIKVTHLMIPRTGMWSYDEAPEEFVIPGYELKTDANQSIKDKYKEPLKLNTEAFYAFLGFYFAEGGVDKREGKNRVLIYQNEGKKAEEFREVLKQLSPQLEWHETLRYTKSITFSTTDARLKNFLIEFGDIYTKKIPDFIKNSHPHLLEIFFNWYVKGDGTIVNDRGRDRCSVFTVSKDMIEDLHEIVLKLGSCGTIKEQVSKQDYSYADRIIKAENKSILYRLWIETSKNIHLDFRFLKIDEVDFDDTVYCINVDNETFYCRDNNKSFWSGNSSVVNLANASHHITKMWWNEDDLMGKVEILPTPSGNILKSLLNAGITLGISSRGVGSVKEVFTEDRQTYLQVQEDFELIAFDFVSNPSTHGAFMIPVNEAVNKGENKDKKINDIITNIICDVQGFCSCD
jgi:hypothetical protein